MLGIDELVILVGMVSPIVFSAGPTNLMCAASGAKYGIRNSFPFVVGLNLMVFIPAFVIGMGAETLFREFPEVFIFAKYLGAFFIFYLAHKFFRSGELEKGKLEENVPSLLDGILVQFVNVKGLALLILLYSQVTHETTGDVQMVFMLSIILTIMSVVSHVSWLWGGAWLTKKFASPRAIKYQGKVFGFLLASVGVWVLFN